MQWLTFIHILNSRKIKHRRQRYVSSSESDTDEVNSLVFLNGSNLQTWQIFVFFLHFFLNRNLLEEISPCWMRHSNERKKFNIVLIIFPEILVDNWNSSYRPCELFPERTILLFFSPLTIIDLLFSLFFLFSISTIDRIIILVDVISFI